MNAWSTFAKVITYLKIIKLRNLQMTIGKIHGLIKIHVFFSTS